MHSAALETVTPPTVYVIATTFGGTRAALLAAIPLARGSRARLVLLVPQVVPYPLLVDGPVDATAGLTGRYRDLVHELDGEAEVRLCLCRHEDEVIWRLLPSRSTVVVGGGAGTWVASRAERLGHRLTHLGHHVIFAPIDEQPVERNEAQSELMYPVIVDLGARRYFMGLIAAVAIGMTQI